MPEAFCFQSTSGGFGLGGSGGIGLPSGKNMFQYLLLWAGEGSILASQDGGKAHSSNEPRKAWTHCTVIVQVADCAYSNPRYPCSLFMVAVAVNAWPVLTVPEKFTVATR